MFPPDCIAFFVVIFIVMVTIARVSKSASDELAPRFGSMDIEVRTIGSAISVASLPQDAADVIKGMIAEATAMCAGADTDGMRIYVDEALAEKIAEAARVAVEAARTYAARDAKQYGGAAGSIAIEARLLGSHGSPAMDPRYVEARVVFVRRLPERTLASLRVFGDQVWRMWLLPGNGTGECTKCGGPVRTSGPGTCAYCGAPYRDFVWKVLQVDSTAHSDAYLAQTVPSLLGRSFDDVVDRFSLVAPKRPNAPSSATNVKDERERIVKAARDLEQALSRELKG